jgi:hypothetical protein
MVKRMLKIKLIGNIGISIISGITALSLAGVAMQMGYSNFKIKAEKQLHILNSIRFATIIQIGMEESWVEFPENGNHVIITLSEVDTNFQLSTNLKNPSLNSQNYHSDSSMKIENTNGKIHFFCTLIEENSTHNYTDNSIDVHDLTVENIMLNI